MGNITWMFSEKGGYLPASTHGEVAEYSKYGFVPCGNPVDHKNNLLKSFDVDSLLSFADLVPSNEISREELIKLADESNIKIDRRWSIEKLKQALGL
jgi:hypothetical protein